MTSDRNRTTEQRSKGGRDGTTRRGHRLGTSGRLRCTDPADRGKEGEGTRGPGAIISLFGIPEMEGMRWGATDPGERLAVVLQPLLRRIDDKQSGEKPESEYVHWNKVVEVVR